MDRKNIMLGTRIRVLREKQGLSESELAAASGFLTATIQEIEEGRVEHLSIGELLRLTDELGLNDKHELTYLHLLSKHPRKFKAYNIGIERTGTRSITGLFAKYHSSHEFMWPETLRKIMDYKNGIASKAEFKSFIRERDSRGLLELDSAGFTRFYLDILVEEFPSARFIFCIRDCYSWLDSIVNVYLDGVNDSPLIQEYTEFIFGVRKKVFADEEQFRADFHNYIDGILAYWATANEEILSKIPPDRSIVLRTNEISQRKEEIEKFIGFELSSGAGNGVHFNKAAGRFDILRGCDFGFLEEKFESHCSSLMGRFFPEYSLKRFLKETG